MKLPAMKKLFLVLLTAGLLVIGSIQGARLPHYNNRITQIREAAQAGQKDKLLLLLNMTKDYDRLANFSMIASYALWPAVERKHWHIVATILRAAPEIRDLTFLVNNTELSNRFIEAAEHGDLATCTLLYPIKAIRRDYYFTGRIRLGQFLRLARHGALIAAAGNGHHEIVKLLLQDETESDIVPVKLKALVAAVKNGHLNVVKALTNTGIPINTKLAADTLTETFITAVRIGHLDLVNYFLDYSLILEILKGDKKIEEAAYRAAHENGHHEVAAHIRVAMHPTSCVIM